MSIFVLNPALGLTYNNKVICRYCVVSLSIRLSSLLFLEDMSCPFAFRVTELCTQAEITLGIAFGVKRSKVKVTARRLYDAVWCSCLFVY